MFHGRERKALVLLICVGSSLCKCASCIRFARFRIIHLRREKEPRLYRSSNLTVALQLARVCHEGI